MSNMGSSLPSTQGSLQAAAQAAATGAGLSPDQVPIFMALINQESGWNPNAVSPAGAQGLGQLMPATATSLGVTNPMDPVENLRASAQLFKQNLQTFGGQVDLALAAYNAGPAAVRKYGGVPPYQETQNYVKNIMSAASENGGGNVDGGDQDNGGAVGSPQPGTNFPPVTDPIPPPGGVHGGEPGNPPWIDQYPPGTIANLDPAAKNAALQTQLQSNLNILGKFNNPGSLLASIASSGVRMPTAAEQVGVANQRNNFTFKVSSGASNISKAAAGAIATAREYLGTPYVWGGESAKGFDCSGLLQYVYAKQGINIPRTTYDQFKTGAPVPLNKLQPGDAVFFKGSDSIVQNGQTLPGHVAIYIGNNEIIQAPHTGATVEVTPLKDMSGIMGARRYGTTKA